MKLPVSSYKVLRMILLGYLHQGGSDRKPAPLKAVSGATGITHTQVSGNNRALADLGLIEREGNSGYRLTDEGLEVARALEFEERELIRRSLGSLLSNHETISKILNVVRLRGGLDAESLTKQIMMASGEPKASSSAQTGARAVIDLLQEASLLELDGDHFVAASSQQPTPEVEQPIEEDKEGSHEAKVPTGVATATDPGCRGRPGKRTLASR